MDSMDHDHVRSSNTCDGAPAGLCTRCTTLDLNSLWSSTGTKLALGTISTWSVDSCLFCRFLTDVLDPLPRTRNQEPSIQGPSSAVTSAAQDTSSYYLYSMKTRKLSERLLQILEPRMVVLSDSDHGSPPQGIPFLAVNPNASNPPAWLKSISSVIDFAQPREWLRLCDQLHGNHCSGGLHDHVSDLRLIDCTNGQVIKATGDEIYVALSYVWGRRDDSQSQLSSYPQTVKDAFIATRKLGYNWLWVDQYCMNQKNLPEFHHQLQHMDAIYRQAVVTLVAAAGTHADYGLPGVSQRLRKSNPAVTLPQGHVAAIRGVPDLSSADCKWSTRAWTYQEGLLSTKRLVFTDEQLYFECQGLYCTEMLDIPHETWEKMHHRDHPYLHPLYRIDPHMGIFPLDRCGVDPWDIFKRITEYSQRSLTYKADILKGMLGIFRAFEREKNPLRHLYGIPFPRMATSSPNSTTSERNSKRRLPAFSESLRWTLEKPSERREGFPSWSWTGWFGTIAWPNTYTAGAYPYRTPRRLEHPRDPKVNEKMIQVSVELRNGDTIDWSTFQRRYHDLLISSELSDVIYLEAYMTPTIYLHDGEHFQMTMHLRCENGQSMPIVVERTTTKQLRSQDRFLAVHFHQTASGNQGRNDQMAAKLRSSVLKQHILIVQEVGRHWERVAIGAFVIDAQAHVSRTWQSLRLG